MRLPFPRSANLKQLDWRRYLPLLLVLVGLGLMGYVASEYYGMYRAQKRLEAQWEQEQKTSPAADIKAAVVDDGLIRVTIPKINLSAIVLDGTTRTQLKNGPGRVTGTPLPGEIGNSVISAHRDTFFRHIYELQKGDTIEVQRKGERLQFEVTRKKIVDPDDISVLEPTSDAELTLITCYPTYYIGPAPQRLVVFSKLVAKDRAGL